ncbi:MAG: glutamate--cysteine ligase [Deltaproteobacteria bacterium]|nr:glutamate--cysteine ligase [Deltaproteobacteria bacterium]
MNLHQLNEHFIGHHKALNRYFEEQFKKTPALFYVSCDVRNSGFKTAVVDTNVFPAGFNNLCASFSRLATAEIKNYLTHTYPEIKKILLFTEAHTRNKFYFENVARLSQMLTDAGYEIKVGTVSEEISGDSLSIPLSSQNLDLFRIKKEGKGLYIAQDWEPELILSNNDFSNGLPEEFRNISQKIIPPPQLGWFQRKKSTHFEFYNQIATEIGQVTDLDPWLISCFFTEANEVKLNERQGIEKLALIVDETLKKIQKKYLDYGIQNPPYVFVKNNSGTYGMGVEYFSSAEEILEMNRRTRNKLLSAKGNNPVGSFLIQEGIVTADSYSGYPIEPVIYMVGENEIGGFFRINELKDEWSSLNSKGMAFSCLCLHKLDEPHEGHYLKCPEKQTLLKLSFLLGKIAVLAAAREAYSA